MSSECHQRFLAFKKQTCHQGQLASSSNFKRRYERIHEDNTRRSLSCCPSHLFPLPTMLDIEGIFVRFIDDRIRISWTRVIVRDADLYSKRSRHGSTADPISILVQLALAWLALSIGGGRDSASHVLPPLRPWSPLVGQTIWRPLLIVVGVTLLVFLVSFSLTPDPRGGCPHPRRRHTLAAPRKPLRTKPERCARQPGASSTARPWQTVLRPGPLLWQRAGSR